MTLEELERGRELASKIVRTERHLAHIEKHDVEVNVCLFNETISISPEVKSTITWIAIADMKSQLESLQKEFDAL